MHFVGGDTVEKSDQTAGDLVRCAAHGEDDAGVVLSSLEILLSEALKVFAVVRQDRPPLHAGENELV